MCHSVGARSRKWRRKAPGNVGVPLAIAYFQHGSITKGIDIKHAVRNGRDTFSMICLPKKGSCGNGVPFGFGPWGNFGLAWRNLCAMGMG